jgi:hypothetical protein
MDRYGGCFSPESPVKMFDGSSCEIQFLRRGMRVWGGACVQYILRMNYNAVVPMVFLEAAANRKKEGKSAPFWRQVQLTLFYQALLLLLSRLGIPFSLMANGAFPAAFAAPPPSTWTVFTTSCSLQAT